MCKVFDRFPRTNIPDTFSSWSDYENFVNCWCAPTASDNAKKIWWDIRPHPFFNTIEIRVCDIPMRGGRDAGAPVAALILATVVKPTGCMPATRAGACTAARC